VGGECFEGLSALVDVLVFVARRVPLDVLDAYVEFVLVDGGGSRYFEEGRFVGD
jgi:hypothetical protein